MIDTNKRFDAFGLLETAMNLSDLYKEKDIDKDVNVIFCGTTERLVIRFIDWRSLDSETTEYTLKLDRDYPNGALEKAYGFMTKEFVTYE